MLRGVQTLLVALCVGLQLGARRLQMRLGQPRAGGWLLPWLADARRAKALRWVTNLRPRCCLAAAGLATAKLSCPRALV